MFASLYFKFQHDKPHTFGILTFFTYSTARRRRRLSGRHMYMFSRHRKLDFCKIISFISGLEC